MKIIWWIVSFTRAVRQTFLTSLFGSAISVCKHTPTCSEYLVLSIKKHGILRGTILGFSRIMTCY